MIIITVTRQLMFMAMQGLFKYNDDLYKQIDGVMLMGSPLGTTLAIFFLGCLEKMFENNCNVAPKLYMLYIDNTFGLFDIKKIVLSFQIF